MAQPITFIVPGQEQMMRGVTEAALPAGLVQGRVKHSVRLGGTRAGTGEVRISAVPDEDVVVLRIENGPMLVLHPENARDLFLAQSTIKRRGGEAAPDEIAVPVQLEWRGLEQNIVTTRGTARGRLGDVLLSSVEVITGLVKGGADFVASEVVKKVDAQVDAGVYKLSPGALPKLKGSGSKLDQIKVSPEDGPILVLVHGTFSDTSSSFGKLWDQHPQRVQRLFRQYGDRVYALDHPTLGVGPITNALDLARALPKGARLHLLTHSRGGLVAEVLARVCANGGLTEEDYKLFSDSAYKAQSEALRALDALAKEKSIRVERIVRVACPARGTLLASKRLDAYVSVFNWTLGAAGIPVAPELVSFLGEVARRRADPEQLPGLAAQIPDSPLVQWLHMPDEAIPGQLRVVAGDIQGDSITSWLKTLLADSYYWTDNDLVVQTSSMYGGSPRASGASFVFDQGGKVSHFRYFSNENTAEAIVSALVEEAPQGFRTIGPLSWSGKSSTGLRGARLRLSDGRSASEKPAVFVLPGILGSNLQVNGNRIWLGWRILNGLTLLRYDPKQPDDIKPDGAIESIYDDLEGFLSISHEVIEFDYDWRRPMEEEARRLAGKVEAALDAREKSGQPVRIVAHSMGGLVARTMQLECPQTWARMMSRPGARMLMLGTPNGGSWAPMQVLSGDDTFGNTLIAFGAPFQDHKAREMMAAFPGFIQLQAALLDGALGLDRMETWKALANDDLKKVQEYNWWHSDGRQLSPYIWGVPPQEVLDQAVSLRKRLDAQRNKDLGAFKDRMLLVVGRARFTPDGYQVGDEGLFYLDAEEGGDGRVTLENAMLPGIRVWSFDCEHGKLPSKPEAFDAYRELLERGDTSRLQPLSQEGVAGRGAMLPLPQPTHVPSRPSRARLGLPPESTQEIFALPSREIAGTMDSARAPLRITVTNGNLKFIRQPLMLGHYRSTRLTGSEHIMDELVGGKMRRSLNAGDYPDLPGSYDISRNTEVNQVNPLQLPRPEAIIVVGLGQEGNLRSTDLIKTVRQGVIGWSKRIADAGLGTPLRFELASTLIGSGGIGISAGQAARLIVTGVREANEILAKTGLPCAGHVQLVELYLDRATEAWHALKVLTTAEPENYAVTETIQTGTGPLRRPLDPSYRGVDYDLITAVTQADGGAGDVIAYTMDTKRARAEMRTQATQGALLRGLVEQASNGQTMGMELGQTLFQLLVPIDMRPFLGGTTEMQIELDSGTAVIPWEMLDTESGTRGGGDRRPWAVRAKLLRRLRTEDFRPQVVDAERESRVLVIGEPKCDERRYPRLRGARLEAKAVADRLTAPGALSDELVMRLISNEDAANPSIDASTVINALLNPRGWRIVHIAGHGEPPENARTPLAMPDGMPMPQKNRSQGGVVLSDGTFLGSLEIKSMLRVPELVFVNCCHLAARSIDQLLQPAQALEYNRPRFAANVAEALINIGVRCVIAAGWAVDDNAAKTFAETFYSALLAGQRFIDAVALAREAAWKLGGNTWAAYQCYGDPNWVFRPNTADARRSRRPLSEEFSAVASPASLALALESLAVNGSFEKVDREEQRDKIDHLEKNYAPYWGGIGAVAEAFGLARAGIGDWESAITWYEAALSANDASASLKASEQLGNLRTRLAWKTVEDAKRREDASAVEEILSPTGKKPGSLNAALTKARSQIKEALRLLEKLVELKPTLERESLCGSAYKRLSMIDALAGNADDEMAAIHRMKEHYHAAELLARKNDHPDVFYPALNRIAAELIVDAGKPDWKGLDADAIAAIRQSLNQKVHDDPDFWSMVSVVELHIYESIARGKLSSELGSIERDCEDLHRRVPSLEKWASVRDQGYFVLTKYMGRATANEQKAAMALLKRMDEWAGLESVSFKIPMPADQSKELARQNGRRRTSAPALANTASSAAVQGL